MPYKPEETLTMSGVMALADKMLAPAHAPLPAVAPEPPPYWSGAKLPKRVVLLDPDTGAVVVGHVHAGALTVLHDYRIDRPFDSVDPFVRAPGLQQRLDLELRSMARGEAEDYLRRALSMACELAAQL